MSTTISNNQTKQVDTKWCRQQSTVKHNKWSIDTKCCMTTISNSQTQQVEYRHQVVSTTISNSQTQQVEYRQQVVSTTISNSQTQQVEYRQQVDNNQQQSNTSSIDTKWSTTINSQTQQVEYRHQVVSTTINNQTQQVEYRHQVVLTTVRRTVQLHNKQTSQRTSGVDITISMTSTHNKWSIDSQVVSTNEFTVNFTEHL